MDAKDVKELPLTRKHNSIYAFMLYEASYLPQVMSWVTKLDKKNNSNELPNQILKEVASQHKKFIRNAKPSVYRNLLKTISVARDNKADFVNMYIRHSNEIAEAKRHNINTDIDGCMRMAMLFVLQCLEEEDKLSLGKDEKANKNILQFFGKIIEMTESQKTFSPKFKKVKVDEANQELIKKLEKKIKDLLIRIFTNENLFDIAIKKSMGLYCINLFDYIHEFMAWNDVLITDFWKTNISKKDLSRLIDLVLSSYSYDKEFLESLNTFVGEAREKLDKKRMESIMSGEDDYVLSKKEFFKEMHSLSTTTEFDKLQRKLINDLVRRTLYLVIVYKLILMFKEARDIANSTIDKNFELEIALQEQKEQHQKDLAKAIAKEKLKKENNVAQKLANQKQQQLNELQLKYDKLLAQYKDTQAENRFLNESLNNALDSLDALESKRNESSPDDDTTVISEEPYPAGTILFGGHPIWQQKFAIKHPEVKIVSGTKNFPENIVSPLTPLVLVNTYHLQHKFSYKIKRLQQRQGWQIKYLSPFKEPETK